ncbi:MAG TPA: 30S ribosomal protein S11 [Candidatus Paceibacterota bacterium]
MGKKRIVAQSGITAVVAKPTIATSSKKKYTHGVLYIQSTYNNTKLTLADSAGQALGWSSSGALGFRGAKKGTTFAAGKVGELMADKASNLGIKEVEVVIKGVGSGRESAMRAFASKGINLTAIKDATPIPFNGPKPKKPRRV